MHLSLPVLDLSRPGPQGRYHQGSGSAAFLLALWLLSPLPAFAAANADSSEFDPGQLYLTALDADHIAGTYSRDGVSVQFDARDADTGATLVLAVPAEQGQPARELYRGHYLGTTYDISILGGRQRQHGTWNPDTEAFAQQQTSGDPEALTELLQSEPYRLLPYLSRALGARGVTGRSSPFILPLYHLAMGAANFHDIEVPALDAAQAASASTNAWHFETMLQPPHADLSSALSGFALGTNSSYVQYFSTNNELVQLVITGSESTYSQPRVQAAAPVAKAGSPLISFASKGTSRIYYISEMDNHIIELWYNGSTFQYNDLTQIADAPVPGSASALTGFAVNGNSPRIYYISSGNHIVELWYQGSGTSYAYNDLTSIADAPLPATNSPLSSFAVNGNSPRIYYISSGNHIVELWYKGSGTNYGYNDLTSIASAPLPLNASPLSSLAINGNSPRIYYISEDNDLIAIVYQGSGSNYAYNNIDLPPSAPPIEGSPLASFALGGNSPRIYYLNNDSDLMEVTWNTSINSYTEVNVTLAARARKFDHISSLQSFQVDNMPRVFAVGNQGGIQRYWYGVCLSQQGNGCNNNCLGMCGKGCSCWSWVCGNCCINRNCLLHDRLCMGCFTFPPPITRNCALCFAPAWVPVMGCGTPISQCAL